MSVTLAKPLVMRVLAQSQEARNDDRWLILKTWELQGLVLSKEQQQIFLHKTYSAESIRRVRQILQAKGQYKATDRVTTQRKRKAKQMSDELRKKKWEPIIGIYGKIESYREIYG